MEPAPKKWRGNAYITASARRLVHRDHIDDNESDSHIEGNLFLNFTTNHPPRSASCAVTTGEGSGVSTNLHTQRLVVARNIFWGRDCGIPIAPLTPPAGITAAPRRLP